MTQIYSVIDNFTGLYTGLESALPQRGSNSVRSHEDINEQDREFAALRGASEDWRQFEANVHSEGWWRELMSLASIEVPDGFVFDPDFVEPRKGLYRVPTETVYYGRLDIGYGNPGYGAAGSGTGGSGPHIDLHNRYISGLLYFTDQSEIEGGQFLVHDPDTMEVSEAIDLKKNRAVVSLQNDYMYHSVRPLVSGRRIAAYFALSSTAPIWSRDSRSK